MHSIILVVPFLEAIAALLTIVEKVMALNDLRAKRKANEKEKGKTIQ